MLQPLQNGQFGAKIDIAKNVQKTTLQPCYSYYIKQPLEKTANTAKMRSFRKVAKISHFPKANPFAKWLVWDENSYCQKHAKNHSTIKLKLIYAKNRSKELLIFQL